MIGGGQVIIAGNSLGAYASLAAAAERPDLISAGDAHEWVCGTGSLRWKACITLVIMGNNYHTSSDGTGDCLSALPVLQLRFSMVLGPSATGLSQSASPPLLLTPPPPWRP